MSGASPPHRRRFASYDPTAKLLGAFVHPTVEPLHPPYLELRGSHQGDDKMLWPSPHGREVAQDPGNGLPPDFSRRGASFKVHIPNEAIGFEELDLGPPRSLQDRTIISRASQHTGTTLQEGSEAGHHLVLTIMG